MGDSYRFVEPEETIDRAVQREVLEETGVRAELKGLIAVHSRLTSSENSAYFIFLMQAGNEETRADGLEVDAAQYFSLAEVQTLSRLNALSRLMVTRVLEQKTSLLAFHPHPAYSPSEYVLYF